MGHFRRRARSRQWRRSASAVRQTCGSGVFVGVCEADADGPEDQHDDGEEDGKVQQVGFAYGLREEALLARIEGAGSDEHGEAHAPEMPRATTAVGVYWRAVAWSDFWEWWS